MKFILLVLLINNLSVGLGDLNVGDEMVIDFDRTYTRALCSGQTCRDFLVSCSGKEVIKFKPISGFVTFGDDWVDKRTEKPIC